MTVESREGLRGRLAAARRGIPAVERAERARGLHTILLAHAWFREARVVAAYAAFGAEVPLLDALEPDRRVVALPVTRGARFTLHQWDGRALGPGAWRVPEPDASAPSVSPADVDLWLIPGIAFDRGGARLGRGAGHYDRVLAEAGGRRVGVCWREQVVDHVPVEPHDVAMHALLTDDGWWEVRPGRA